MTQSVNRGWILALFLCVCQQQLRVTVDLFKRHLVGQSADRDRSGVRDKQI